MKKNDLLRLLLLFFVVVAALPAVAAEPSFRGFIWGLSKEDVRRYENAAFYQETPSTLVFVEEPDDFRRLIRYEFMDGKLINGSEEYVELHYPEPERILDLYGDIRTRLIRQYGQPEKDETFWQARTYQHHPQFWARAVASGDLRLRATWRMKDTRLTLDLFRDPPDYQIVAKAVQESAAGQADKAASGFTFDPIRINE